MASYNWPLDQAQHHLTDPANIAEGRVHLDISMSDHENIQELKDLGRTHGWHARLDHKTNTLKFTRIEKAGDRT